MVVNYSSNISSQLEIFIKCSVGAQCLSAGTKISLFLCSESIEWDQIFTRLESCILMGRRWSLWAWWSTPLVRCDMFSARGLQSCDRTVSTILSFSWLYLVTWVPGMHEHLEAISWLEINKILCNLASMTNTSVLVMNCQIYELQDHVYCLSEASCIINHFVDPSINT